jgi:hypothetical protein
MPRTALVAPSWRPGYAVVALLLFLMEVAIALWVRDAFVRPYLGDALAVILVYLVLRAITTWRVIPAALIALGVGLAVEIGQAMNLLDLLDLSGHAVARVVFGTSFSIGDIVCYAAGAAIAVLDESARERIAGRSKGDRAPV